MGKKTGRNDPCPCGSGKKYKHCCLSKERPGRSRNQPVEPEGYRGPQGGYAPAIRPHRQGPDREQSGQDLLVNPERRFESRREARASAARDFAASKGGLEGPFREHTLAGALRQAGYMPEEEVNLDGWARQLAELEENAAATGQGRPKCGLCGNTINLTRTECCDNWICDDEWAYRPFSYGRNSCYRNHRRYTVCGIHHAEGHEGDWKECEECRDFYIATEQYVHAATNEWNFEKLENPPDYEPTHCAECGRVIRLAQGGYMMSGGDFICARCAGPQFF